MHLHTQYKPSDIHPVKLFTYLLTPLSSVLLEKLISSQQVKKFPAFYRTHSLLHLQVPATCLYPKPEQSSQYPPIPP